MTAVDKKTLCLALLLGVVAWSPSNAKNVDTAHNAEKAIVAINSDNVVSHGSFPSISAASSTTANEGTPPLLETASTHGLHQGVFEQASVIQKHLLEKLGPWLTETGISTNAHQLIHSIQDAAVHGLNPGAYGLNSLLDIIDQLNSLNQKSVFSDRFDASTILSEATPLRAKLSEDLNATFLNYASHLGQGVVDAQSIQPYLFRAAPKTDATQLLTDLHLGKHSVNSALVSVAPTHDEYRRLTRRMRDLLTERATGVKRSSVQTNSSMAQIDLNRDAHEVANFQTVNDILNIQRRLIETGELPFATELVTVWSKPILQALKTFQKRHGIQQTGIPDQRTRTSLNFTIDQEIQAVALSLERWRWMPRHLGDTYVFVNIPDYRVVVRQGSENLLAMNAVVGATDSPTPAFSRNMSYMEFNPTWTVPDSIANKELIPLERSQPGYLESQGFNFFKFKGSKLIEVPSSKVTNADFNRKQFPYVLRQRGGPRNTLGRLKFMMPNPYAIYLHDTLHKQHFTLEDRAFSHGCIRLNKPEKLARTLLEHDGFTEQSITNAIDSTETTRIDLRQSIPTHLTYLTTWVDDQDVLQRRKDIYQYDQFLLQALESSDTLLSILSQEDPAPASGDA